MKTLLVILSLFILSGCGSMEFVAVDYHSGHNYGPYVRPVGHISYTLGYYSDSHYNGYSVHGSHGNRYYYAPTHYSHHRYYSAPPVVVRHVHTSVCYVRGGHSYVAPRHTPVTRYRAPPVTPRAAPPRQRDNRVDRQDRREDRTDRQDRRGKKKEHRK